VDLEILLLGALLTVLSVAIGAGLWYLTHLTMQLDRPELRLQTSQPAMVAVAVRTRPAPRRAPAARAALARPPEPLLVETCRQERGAWSRNE
jgi:hypothetical protein